MLTKCGGPSPKGYFPYAKNMIVFSQEDYIYFKQNGKYINSLIYHIPNRLNEFPSNHEKIENLRAKYDLDRKLVFLRICRICQFYYKSIEQSINLINKLSEKHNNIILLIIGNIQEQNIYKKLKIKINSNKNIYIISESDYTSDAKEIIDIANIVIGTGRGFMEACSKSKVMLVPSKNSNYPILITDENFDVAFNKNFSERIHFSNNIIDENLSKIEMLLNNDKYIDELRLKNYEKFQQYFNLSSAINRYVSVYGNIKYSNDNMFDIFFHRFFVLKNNVGTWYRIIRNNIFRNLGFENGK